MKELEASNRLVGEVTVKVQLYPNGVSDTTPLDHVLNVKQLRKVAAAGRDEVDALLDDINTLEG